MDKINYAKLESIKSRLEQLRQEIDPLDLDMDSSGVNDLFLDLEDYLQTILDKIFFKVLNK